MVGTVDLRVNHTKEDDMRTRRLGSSGGVGGRSGCMGFSHGYGPGVGEAEAIDLMRAAFDLGCTFFDTAEGYAAGDNERLVGRALAPIRHQVVIATKFRVADSASAHGGGPADPGPPAGVADPSRDRPRRPVLPAPSIAVGPRRNVAAVMGELIAEGTIGGWGQSQATEDQIRRAHAVTPLSAIQSEYSIMERMFEADVIPACAELGIGFVPFSPLASGFLSGKVTANDTYTGDDVRRVITRFDKDNIRANQPLLELISDFANAKGVTPAQISLAWMLHKNDFIVPIPGSRKLERIQENLGAADVDLTTDEFFQIEAELAKIEIHGNRTDEDIAKLKQTD